MKWKCPFCGYENESEKLVCEVCGKQFKWKKGKLVEVKKRPPEFWISIFILTFAIIFNAVLIGVEYASDPKICTSCHEMEKYFESWNESTHKGIKCYECHYGRGVLNFLRGTYHSLSVLQPKVPPYVNLPANISSENCLSCHDDIEKIKYIQYGEINFSHVNHLNGYKRGFLKLECVSCHREIVIGSHIAVKNSTCFVCHFYETPEGVPISGCPSCHNYHDIEFVVGNKTFKHSVHVERGIKCIFCHEKTYVLIGKMETKCKKCHVREINATLPDLTMHGIHVNKLKLDCLQCHPDIVHKPIVSEEKCKTCHPSIKYEKEEKKEERKREEAKKERKEGEGVVIVP